MLSRESLTIHHHKLQDPFKVWSNKPVEYSMLKVFGCPTYYHVSEGKLKPRGKKEFFMGYGDGVKGFLDIIYHFIHSKKRVEVPKVNTWESPTDMFTKAYFKKQVHALLIS